MKKLCWIFHCISIFILLSSWIFTSKALNKTMERVHEKALTSVLNDHESTLMESLTYSKKKKAHQLYIDRLLIEVYKFLNATTLIYTVFLFFLRNAFPKTDSMFLKIFSIRAWNAFYKFWFTPSPKNGYLQCAQFYCFFLPNSK